MFEDAIKLIDTVVNGGGLSKKVERSILDNGLQVSTVDTDDMGLETAIIDKNSCYIVESYSTYDEAKAGHLRWSEFAEDGIGKTITDIGYGCFIGPKEVILVY